MIAPYPRPHEEPNERKLIRKGLARYVGTDINGKPVYRTTWKGRKAFAMVWLRELREAIVEMLYDPFDATMIAIAVVSLVVLSIMYASEHIVRALGGPTI
jgi:hypothetical protein